MSDTRCPASLTEAGFFKSVEDFAAFSGGDHAIKKILIANNGIGATKAIRSIRRWSFETFGNEKAIKFVVMATPEDMRANAEYIRMADQVVDVPGGSNNNNYANITLICQIADHLKVDAVMPMWGHASENPALPTSLKAIKHKVTFIGPAAEPMQALGDKIGSTIIAQSAGVPTIAWNGDDLKVDYQPDTGIPDSVYDQANVTTAEAALACCERIGYPVMIKASEGGGGKGIRKVHRSEDVLSLFRQVQGEIPGSPIFVMKMASSARHLEVQLLADRHGEAIALSGRDCSVQRRHQKIIEEGPPTAAPTSVFKKMERAAVALAKTVGYCNAGTVEYLYMEETQKFAFLELNPRLQVEHPVTENILGLNLPACQLQVAMGIPLHRIADIRRMYGRHPMGRDTIDFEYTERVPNPRHCIAVRVTAENPEAGFQPTSGNIKELQFLSSIDVWGYFSVNNSGLVHEFADSQFGHIFAGGKDRESARRAMVVALKELQIRGDIHTTTEYIIKMLQSDDFVANRINTDWLDERIAKHGEISRIERKRFCPSPKLVATCGAALQGYKYFMDRDAEFIKMLRAGQVPTKDTLSPRVSTDLIFENTKYITTCLQSGGENVVIECNGQHQDVSVRNLADGGYMMIVAGQSHVAYMREESDGSLRMVLDGNTCIFTPEYDPTRLTSSVAGKLARLLVDDGSHVNAGDPYVEIEVMKMYMPLKALEAGTISFQMSEGATLNPGDLIATVKLDNPDSVVTAEVFDGKLIASAVSEREQLEHQLDGTDCANAVTAPLHVKVRETRRALESVLEGYPLSEEDINQTMESFLGCLKDPLLPALRVQSALSVLRGRIDQELYKKIRSINNTYRDEIELAASTPPAVTSPSKSTTSSTGPPKYPAMEILRALHTTAQATPIDKRGAFNVLTAELWSVAEPFIFTVEEIVLSELVKLMEGYLAVEAKFDDMSFTDVVNKLRKDHMDSLQQVLLLCRSHANAPSKNALMLKVMDVIREFPNYANIKRPVVPKGIIIRSELNTRKIKLRLTELSKLRETLYSHISFSANLLLIEQLKPTAESRRQKLEEALNSALTANDATDRVSRLNRFVDSNVVFHDILVDTLSGDSDYNVAAMELYLRKIYQKTHDLMDFEGGTDVDAESDAACMWVKFNFRTKYVEAVKDGKESGTSSYEDLASLTRHEVERSMLRDRSGSEASQAPSDPVRNVVLGLRSGIFATVDTYDLLASTFPSIIEKLTPNAEHSKPVNAVHVVIMSGVDADKVSEDELSKKLEGFLSSQAALLASRFVRRVTFFVGTATSSGQLSMPIICTFRARMQFKEDVLFRHIEAPHAFHLDLPRLSNFHITLEDGSQTSSGNVHLYRAVPRMGKGSRRYFARLVSYTADVHSSDVESLFVEALDHLALKLGQDEAASRNQHVKPQKSSANHVFVNVVAPDTVVQPDFYDVLLRRLCTKYSYKMNRLGISTVELKLTCRLSLQSEPMFIRLVASNPTGFVLKIDKYYEALQDGRAIFKCISRTTKGSWDGKETQTPYEVEQEFERQRAAAMAASETLYVYDWPMLFEAAAERHWLNYEEQRLKRENLAPPSDVFSCKELVLCDPDTDKPLLPGWTAVDAQRNAVLRPVSRSPGLNDVGMVAWRVHMVTPEYPQGRDIVLICNDITFMAGSFGTREDVVFYKASEYAREHGLPRLFLTANSGARIGMAQSLKRLFNVCWVDPEDPSKGFRYLYLTTDSYAELLQKASGDTSLLPVVCTEVTGPGGAAVMRITDIIGEEPDLGVENLMGSGLIAGETSRAYDQIFTLTLVIGRTVGIGAYLVRLGQRTIQKMRNAPIILTGYQALNKLMGREIYTTNDQLGGPMIMFPNGVSHQLAETHFDTVMQAMEWLSFVPAYRGAPLPLRLMDGIDSVDRAVEFAPQKGITYDPRLLLCGVHTDSGGSLGTVSPSSSSSSSSSSSWQSGFFDRDSFVETLSGWAKTVVVGRGRLGGIPLGVIVTENRTAEATKPADPADATSSEKLVQQAGGVWFPDSAYKTAQALKDFQREGLPCIIFANWRGFSGGQRDMFDEVLKFGSMIVDALVAYQQPLFVYIPPFAELRGGAWVVVDSTINSDAMEFYAAEDARGGVLEAAGAASIKFRDRDVVLTAHRIDPVIVALDKQLAALKENEQSAGEGDAAAAAATAATEEQQSIQKQIRHRERMLFGVYQQVAVHFADLHDTPGRMEAKGVIRRQVRWAESRRFFYWRLRRRLLEFQLARDMSPTGAAGMTTVGQRTQAIAALRDWYCTTTSSGGSGRGNGQSDWEDDCMVVDWLEAHPTEVAAFTAAQRAAACIGEIGTSLTKVVALASAGTMGTVAVGNGTAGGGESAGDVLRQAMQRLTSEERDMILAALK